MAITLTTSAAEHMRRCLADRDKTSAGIRLGVKPSGCSGLSYIVEYANAMQEGDVQFQSNGITVITDPKSLVHLEGMEVDYVRDGLQEGLKFNNPNVKDSCGCGESFTT